VRRLLQRLRGVRVEPARPAPPPVSDADWQTIAATFGPLGPLVIGATGGSGTRVVARIAQRGGMFLGHDLNRSEDALDFAAFSDRWIDRVEHGERSPELVAELRALVARQHTDAGGRPWGWKEPRSLYLLPLLDAELPGLRFLHVVRDGRDMAFSDNQVQLRKHGDAVLGPARGEGEPVRAIALWSAVNLRAADRGENVLRERYLRVRFEDLCAEPAETTARILAFLGLDGDAERIAADEVRTPDTFGRWRGRDVAELEARAGEALARFGYHSSSA
jgi:hypothetical protein